MKRIRERTCGIAGALLAMTLPVFAGPGVEVNVDYVSADVWRGQVYNSSPVLQPSLEASLPVGLALGVWGNMDTTGKHGLGGKFSEVDLWATLDLPAPGPLAWSLGAINYLHPYDDQGEESTTEALLLVEAEFPFNPVLEVAYDLDKVQGFYASIGMSYEHGVGDRSDVTLAASLGWADKDYNEYYFDVDRTRLNDLNVSLALEYYIWAGLNAGVNVTYTRLMNNQIRAGARELYGYADHVYAGMNVSYSF